MNALADKHHMETAVSEQQKQSWRTLRSKILVLVREYSDENTGYPTKVSFTAEDAETILTAPQADIGKDLYPRLQREGLSAVPRPLGMEILTWDAEKTRVSG